MQLHPYAGGRPCNRKQLCVMSATKLQHVRSPDLSCLCSLELTQAGTVAEAPPQPQLLN